MSNNGYYTRDDVNKMLKVKQGSKTITDLAGDIGISAQLLSSVLKRNRQPGTRILKFLKLKKATVYSKG